MEKNPTSVRNANETGKLESPEGRVPELHPEDEQYRDDPSESNLQMNHTAKSTSEIVDENGTTERYEQDIAAEAKAGKDQGVDKPVSKRQLKRMARHQKWLDTKPQRRQKQKEKLRDKKRKLREERERLGIDEDSIRGPKLIKMSDPEASQVSVAIDCGFDHLMNDLEVRKVAKQIQRCYAMNRRSPSPFQLHLCSFNSKTKSWFDGSIQGYSNWDVNIHGTPIGEVFPKEKIVYLSSESDNILQELDPSKAYIIGGLVDHNHQKGLCHQMAVERGWQHAQLPISEFVELNGRKVLTINQVFEILVGFATTSDWKESFYQALPARKVKSFAQSSKEENNTSGSDQVEAENKSERTSIEKDEKGVGENIRLAQTST